jgi:hypothetical protein
MHKSRAFPSLQSLKPSDQAESLDIEVTNTPEVFEALGVLCINCGNYIFSSEVEVHSSTCLRVQDSQYESEGTLKPVKEKLTKLEACLRRSVPIFRRLGDQNYLKILIRLCSGLLLIEDAEGLPDLNKTAESLASLLCTFRGSDSLKLYGERLRALASELEKDVTSLSLKLTVDSLKQQVEFYKSKASSLEKSVLSPRIHLHAESTKAFIDNLDSDIGSRHSDTSDFTSLTSQSESLLYEASESLGKQQEFSPDLKRFFYSKCLAIKLSYPKKSVAHQVPISGLFRLVMEQRIPAEGWTEFIKSRLLKASLVTKTAKASGLKSMTTLHEDSQEEESDKEF